MSVDWDSHGWSVEQTGKKHRGGLNYTIKMGIGISSYHLLTVQNAQYP